MTTSAAAALRLPSELTHRQATACLAQLLQSVGGAAPGSTLVVDAAPLRVFDTSALAVLISMILSIFNFMIKGVTVYWALIGIEPTTLPPMS